MPQTPPDTLENVILNTPPTWLFVRFLTEAALRHIERL